MKFKPSSKLLSVWFIYVFIGIVISISPIGFLLLIPGLEWFVSIYSLCVLIIASLIVLWLRVYVKTINYELTDEGVSVIEGVWWKNWRNVPYHKITNVKVSQGPIIRSFGLADISLQTAGMGASSMPEARIYGMPDFNKIKEEILSRIKKISKKS